MKIFGISLILAAVGGPVWSTVFTPCGLARTLYKLLEGDQLKEIPLLVCIAGYQRFDTNYIAGSGTLGIDHTFQGIFGLLYSDMTKNFPQIYHRHEDRIRQDVVDFLEKVLHLKDSTSHPNYDFYKTVCSSPHVRELSCRLNDYVLINYKVYEPLNPELLDGYRSLPYPSDDQPFLLTDTESSEQCHTTESPAIHSQIFDPLLLHLCLFWMTGSVFYVVARFTYDFLHFKYLRNIIALG